MVFSSIIFYASGGIRELPILFASIICNYLCGIAIHKSSRNINMMKVILTVGIGINIGLLVWYKYANLLVKTVQDLSNIQIAWEQIVLPIGISFYTFQGMSYIIDVYREEKIGNVKYYQAKFSDLALYISLFPQLIAGR